MCNNDINKAEPPFRHDLSQSPYRILHVPPVSLHVLFSGTAALVASPVVVIGSMIYGRSPIMAHLGQLVRYLKYAWTANPTDPPMHPLNRVFLTLFMVETYLTSIVKSAFWLLDEFLYSKQLDQVVLHKPPFFFISGGRSGSTQLSRYLEEDPHLIVPTVMMDRFPYLWAWKIKSPLEPASSKEKAIEKKRMRAHADFAKRHEMDDYKTGTFDPAFMKHHLNMFAMHMGDVVAAVEGPAELAPHNRELVEKDFVRFVDRMARKTLLFRGVDPQKDRFFIKGHFLCSAPALAEKYPDCSMLTVIRDPVKRLRSAINSARSMPPNPMLGRPPIQWMSRTFEHVETRYCEKEQEWFTSNTKEGSNVKKCAVNFEEYVNDLPGTLETIYKECFGMDHVPPEVPTKHEQKKGRGDYDINYTLEELGMNVPALERRLAGYRQWMESIKRNENKN